MARFCGQASTRNGPFPSLAPFLAAVYFFCSKPDKWSSNIRVQDPRVHPSDLCAWMSNGLDIKSTHPVPRGRVQHHLHLLLVTKSQLSLDHRLANPVSKSKTDACFFSSFEITFVSAQVCAFEQFSGNRKRKKPHEAKSWLPFQQE